MVIYFGKSFLILYKAMALKASKLKQIPQRNKDLAFGYLRENEGKHKTNYCQLIKYLVLIYSNQHDQFDLNATHRLLQVNQNGNNSVNKPDNKSMYLSYLKNVVSDGIHVWQFKYDYGEMGQIGVWKTKSGDPILNGVHIDNTTDDADTCTGYAISMEGYKTNPQDVSIWSEEEYEPPQHGDIIEMTLDLNKYSLSFQVGDEVVVQFLDVEHTSYRAAVALFSEGESFTIISYQDFYQ